MNFDLPDVLIPDTPISVSGLTDYLRLLLEQDEHLRQVWVVGEVSSANQHRSGLFFTLQDPDGTAAIKCVAWTNQLAKLAQVPVRGEQLIILGSIRLYPQRGEYQLTVWQALPAGVGLQALRYQQLKKRLEAEGLFDVERKRSLPAHPQIIAVVTSPTAAAWGDIQQTLKDKYPGLQVLLSPATVQGELAPASIVKAIDRVAADGRAEVLILARGGGATEDLACFNDERVVKAVATCPVPVITGLGHKRDESLTDLAADFSVITPTEAAKRVVPALSDLYSQHQQRIIALTQAVQDCQDEAQHKLQFLKNRLRRLRLDQQIKQEQHKLNWQSQRLQQVTVRKLQQASQHLEMLRQKLVSIDPKAVLQRGYAVARKENGAIARSVSELEIGQDLIIQLAQGEVKVKIVEINQQQ